MAVMAVEAGSDLVAGAETSSALAARSKAGGQLATRKGGGRTGGYFGGVTAAPTSSQAARATGPAAKGPGRKKAAAAAAGAEFTSHEVSHRKNIDPTQIDLGVGWHRVVMAEFIAALFVLVFAPILTPATDQSGSKGFFRAADIVRMTAVCMVYFILALLTNGQKLGKVAAAFGGLVLTGVVYNNAIGTQSVFTAIAAIFTSAFTTETASDTSAPTDPDLVYGQVGANVFSQLAAGGPVTPGASTTPTGTSSGGSSTTPPAAGGVGSISPVPRPGGGGTGGGPIFGGGGGAA
jgi:hypothetical protein